ncbi:MAG: RagB/SusD family nutrient uptake outer membrane protein [Marinilabiliales bacterium]|nr:MAG: RagB/SusD family nutrient uptake outer membrane protein [Marinilabiliales bacterium]
MKKTKYLLIVLAVFMQVSCDDWLELLPPEGLTREHFWQTKEEVEAVVMGAYEAFRGMDGHLFRLGELRADMITDGGNMPDADRRIMNGNIHPDNHLTNWNNFYRIINYCNEVIENAPEVRLIDDTFTDYQLQAYLAEAYFLRSLSYFYLVRVYRDVPLVLHSTSTDEAEVYLPKTDGDEILIHIRSELEQFRRYAPVEGYRTIVENKGRATRAAYDALLADIALWQFDYEAVIDYVERIERADNHLLLMSSRWFELFHPGNTAEGIFELQFDDNLGQQNSLYGMTNRNANYFDPSQVAIQMFGRRYARELYRGEDASIKRYGEDEFIIWKYVGLAGDGTSTRPGFLQRSANFIVYRYADVLLMKAEALSQLGRFSEALDIINDIRNRADVPPISLPASEIAYEDAILNERAREFAYEGKRWFDLLRMGRRNNYARKNVLINILVSNVPSTQKRILSMKLNNPLGWYLPIYDQEIESNRNLVQNPYYDY